ncbi:hypothetical protein PILCRDRAFT_2743 [Piloderma croceum F 1598]|uniref:Ribonuclease H1 N-terminal domain-containing protein n=1 Tax=Piloderma croceum (strain F 1598) TaxID=765440 RepID=A0A0C3FVK5_PILCF|nr:hypothetical protein PILCRDRAFT_2743 [Piloderma croceum F 1598]
MSLIYADALQDDEEISRLLAAIYIGDRSPAVGTSSASPAHRPASQIPSAVATRVSHGPSAAAVVSRPERSLVVQGKDSAPPASTPHQLAPEQPRASNENTRGKYPLAINVIIRINAINISQKPCLSRESPAVKRSPTMPDAGDATQGVPGGKVYKMQVQVTRKHRKGRRVAYVVFEGLATGVFDTWEQVEPLVKGVPGNIHQGFDHRIHAEHAYVVAFAMGAVHVLPPRRSSQLTPSPAAPMSQAVMAAFSLTSSNFLGAEWHVVFKGKRPGIYPAWNFTATQTKGVSCSIYQKYPTKAEAEAAYRNAECDGFVEIL